MYCFGNAVQPVKGIVLTFSEVTKQMSVHSRPEFNFTSFFSLTNQQVYWVYLQRRGVTYRSMNESSRALSPLHHG